MQAAEALLCTVRHLMTGREIDICEKIAEGAPITPENIFREVNGERLETISELDTFRSLRIQFYAKIINFIDAGIWRPLV